MLKRVHINTSDGNKIEIFIKELYLDNSQSIFIWPSSLVLSAYLACHPEICSNHIFYELGAGTGLPSLVAAKLNALKCYITEKGNPIQFELLQYNISINQVEHICQVEGLNWGDVITLPASSTSSSSTTSSSSSSSSSTSSCIDDENKNKNNTDIPSCSSIHYIIAADLFYSSEDFDNILKSVASVLHNSSSNNSNNSNDNNTPSSPVIFLATYHQRSIQRTLLPYLDKYDLCCTVEHLSSFLHTAHTAGECEVIQVAHAVPEASTATTQETATTSTKKKRKMMTMMKSIPTFDEIFLLKIYHV